MACHPIASKILSTKRLFIIRKVFCILFCFRNFSVPFSWCQLRLVWKSPEKKHEKIIAKFIQRTKTLLWLWTDFSNLVLGSRSFKLNKTDIWGEVWPSIKLQIKHHQIKLWHKSCFIWTNLTKYCKFILVVQHLSPMEVHLNLNWTTISLGTYLEYRDHRKCLLTLD